MGNRGVAGVEGIGKRNGAISSSGQIVMNLGGYGASEAGMMRIFIGGNGPVQGVLLSLELPSPREKC